MDFSWVFYIFSSSLFFLFIFFYFICVLFFKFKLILFNVFYFLLIIITIIIIIIMITFPVINTLCFGENKKEKKKKKTDCFFYWNTNLFFETLSAHSREWMCQYVTAVMGCKKNNNTIEIDREKNSRKRRMNADHFYFARLSFDWKLRFWSRQWASEWVSECVVSRNFLSPHCVFIEYICLFSSVVMLLLLLSSSRFHYIILCSLLVCWL